MHTLECLIAVHVRLFFSQIFCCMYGLIRYCMSISNWITEFITYKKPKIITVCIIILSYLYVKYALLQACMFKNSLKKLCLYVYMDCSAIKHSRVGHESQGGQCPHWGIVWLEPESIAQKKGLNFLRLCIYTLDYTHVEKNSTREIVLLVINDNSTICISRVSFIEHYYYTLYRSIL